MRFAWWWVSLNLVGLRKCIIRSSRVRASNKEKGPLSKKTISTDIGYVVYYEHTQAHI